MQIESAFEDIAHNVLILFSICICLLLLQCCCDRSMCMDYLNGAQVRLPHYTEDHAARSVPRT